MIKFRVSNSETKYTTYEGVVEGQGFKVEKVQETFLDDPVQGDKFEERQLKLKKGEVAMIVLAAPVKGLAGKTFAVLEKDIPKHILDILTPPKPKTKTTRKPRTKKPVVPEVKEDKQDVESSGS